MKDNLNSTSTPTTELPVKATSSFFDAFTSLFNLFMILVLAWFIGSNLIRFVISGINIFWLTLTMLAIAFLAYYIWAILNRSLEINKNGVEYQEALRRVSLNWSEIEAIKIEKHKGQITFWVNDKKVRIHTYGLNRQGQREIHKALSTQIKAQNIRVR